MKSRPLFLTLCLAAITLPATADTFIMKDGTQLEGRILREEGDNYVLEVLVTASIKDERVVPKADVEKVVAEKLDEKAFEELAGLTPTPDMLGASDYESRIRKVSAFLAAHPKSEKAADAKEMLATLEKEFEAVSAGGVKLNQQIIPVHEYRSNAYAIDAAVLAGKVRDHVAKNEMLPALRAFDQMATEFQTSKEYAELLPSVLQVMERHEAQVAQMLSGYDARMAEQKTGLERMGAEARNASNQALAEQAAVIESRFQEEKAAKQKWITPHPMHKPSLQESARTAQQELRRLSNLRPPAAQVDPGEVYRKTWETIHNEESDERVIKSAVAAARNARLPARYITMLNDAATAQTAPPVEEGAEEAAAPEAP